MKHLITISTIVFVLFTGKLFAQPKARFTISTTGTIALLATIEGVNYTLPNMAQTWYNLQPGILNVKVFQYQNRQGIEPGYKEIYNGTVRLTEGRHTELVVSRWGKVMFDEFEISNDTWATGIPGLLGQGIAGGQVNSTAVTDAAFAEIKKSLSMEIYADGKLKLAKVLFKNNAFTTGQISELAGQFIYDSDKLVFLKLAYDPCVDKGNYHILARLLKYSSDRDALMEFIGRQ